MVKSSPKELAALREEVFTRDEGCVWPGCQWAFAFHSQWDEAQLQLAHLVHRGMGGSKYANRPDNCVTLCRLHHDIFDGRDGSSNTKRELAVMLKAQIGG